MQGDHPADRQRAAVAPVTASQLDAAEDDSGELPPHLRPAPAPLAVLQRDAASVDAPRDALAAAETAPTERVGGDEEVTPMVAAAERAPQPDGAADRGPSKAEILTRMDEVLLLWWLRMHWCMISAVPTSR